MNSKLNTYIFFGLLLVLFSTCGSDDDAPPLLSSAKAITSFMVDGIAGTIDEGAKTISAEVPNGTDLTSLSPTIITYTRFGKCNGVTN